MPANVSSTGKSKTWRNRWAAFKGSDFLINYTEYRYAVKRSGGGPPYRSRDLVVPFSATIAQMNAKHGHALEAIFARPVPSNLRWADIESLRAALGAERSEGRGSRVRFLLIGQEAVFHRPHPGPDMDKGAVAAIRRFLASAGVTP